MGSFVDNEVVNPDRQGVRFNWGVENEAWVELLYPRANGISHVQIGLEDVRAADSIRVWFDFDRDGWVIEQASKFEFHAGEDLDPDWQEVAFVQAWGRQRESEKLDEG